MVLQVRRYLGSAVMSNATHRRALEVRQRLEAALRDFTISSSHVGCAPFTSPPMARVIVYGSSISGTAFDDGDADYAIVFPIKNCDTMWREEYQQSVDLGLWDVPREVQPAVLSEIYGYLRNSTGLFNDLNGASDPVTTGQNQRIFRARVPIMQIPLRESIPDVVYMAKNTRLRVGALLMKYWGRQEKILNARRGWISPYALTIMYVYFMHRTGRLSTLADEKAVDQTVVQLASRLSQVDNHTSEASGTFGMPELDEVLPFDPTDADVEGAMDDVRGCFAFYSDGKQFDFDTDVVDIRAYGNFRCHEDWKKTLEDLQPAAVWHRLGYGCLMLRDPYEDHNLGRSVDFFRGENIREAFRAAAHSTDVLWAAVTREQEANGAAQLCSSAV